MLMSTVSPAAASTQSEAALPTDSSMSHGQQGAAAQRLPVFVRAWSHVPQITPPRTVQPQGIHPTSRYCSDSPRGSSGPVQQQPGPGSQCLKPEHCGSSFLSASCYQHSLRLDTTHPTQPCLHRHAGQHNCSATWLRFCIWDRKET